MSYIRLVKLTELIAFLEPLLEEEDLTAESLAAALVLKYDILTESYKQ